MDSFYKAIRDKQSIDEGKYAPPIKMTELAETIIGGIAVIATGYLLLLIAAMLQ